MGKLHKTRNDISQPGVAKNRAEIYKSALKQYKLAFENGFYLEAIAICESLITDRLESRIGELSKKEVSFGMLGGLKDVLVNYLETNEILIKLYTEIVDKWAPKRNKAIHQAVKISKEGKKDWHEFSMDAKDAATEGLKLFRKLDKELTKERKLK